LLIEFLHNLCDIENTVFEIAKNSSMENIKSAENDSSVENMELKGFNSNLYDSWLSLCSECSKSYARREACKWCKECNAKRFQQNFSNWTSGNEFIDRFIQETQLNANWVLEWIPYNRLKNIEPLDKGSFITLYEAIWLDGLIENWLLHKNKWIRYNNWKVILKSLDKSSNLSDEFLNEVWYLSHQFINLYKY